jgi:ankyrin repeat protein
MSLITTLVDDDGFNLLHHAALKDTTGKIKMLIDLYREGLLKEENKDENKKIFSSWVNARTTDDQFSPLHFASFSGNIDAIDTLLEFKADMHQKTKTNMTVNHVAA